MYVYMYVYAPRKQEDLPPRKKKRRKEAKAGLRFPSREDDGLAC